MGRSVLIFNSVRIQLCRLHRKHAHVRQLFGIGYYRPERPKMGLTNIGKSSSGETTRKRYVLPVGFMTVRPMIRQTYSTEANLRDHLVQVPIEQDGVKFNLGVVVMGEQHRPVALCSHGVPGGADDFINLVPTLLDSGFRVVLPSYPGYEFSPLEESDLFAMSHSTVAKAELLKSVCKHLRVDSVDMMISHSQGTTAAYKFCADERVKSAVFLAPCGKTPQQTAEPYWAVQTFARTLRNPLLRPLCTKILAFIYKTIGYVQKIAEKKIPCVFVMAKNDRIIEWQNPFKLLQEVQAPLENMVYYDQDNQPSHLFNKDVDKNWYFRGLVFTKGGHLVHRKQEDLVLKQITDLIEFIHPQLCQK